MRFISDKTGKVYTTQEDCLAAEKIFDAEQEKKELAKKQKEETRAKRAKEVEDAYKAYAEARKNYNDLVAKFVKDYGSFHLTLKNDDDVFKTLLDNFWF